MIQVQTFYETAPTDDDPPAASAATDPNHALNRPRAMSVVLKPELMAKLDELAHRSGMKRHRYAINILEQAVAKEIILRQKLVMSEGLVGSITTKLK